VHPSTAALAAAGLLCCHLSGCGMNGGGITVPTVSRMALQQDIAQQLADAGEKPDSVGAVARCELRADGVRSYTVTVSGVRGLMMTFELLPPLA
jgi:hypothetical protein